MDRRSRPLVVCVDDNVDMEPIEKLTHEDEVQTIIVREVDWSFQMGALNDDFDVDAFEEEDANEDGTHDCDNISQGSKDDEVEGESTEEDEDFTISLDSDDEYTSRPSTWDDMVDDEYRFGPSIEDDIG